MHALTSLRKQRRRWCGWERNALPVNLPLAEIHASRKTRVMKLASRRPRQSSGESNLVRDEQGMDSADASRVCGGLEAVRSKLSPPMRARISPTGESVFLDIAELSESCGR